VPALPSSFLVKLLIQPHAKYEKAQTKGTTAVFLAVLMDREDKKSQIIFYK
jgi:hypothetical protein